MKFSDFVSMPSIRAELAAVEIAVEMGLAVVGAAFAPAVDQLHAIEDRVAVTLGVAVEDIELVFAGDFGDAQGYRDEVAALAEKARQEPDSS